jgi:hypothetical protein
MADSTGGSGGSGGGSGAPLGERPGHVVPPSQLESSSQSSAQEVPSRKRSRRRGRGRGRKRRGRFKKARGSDGCNSSGSNKVQAPDHQGAKSTTQTTTNVFDASMDPITRESLEGKHIYEFTRPNGLVVRYDAVTLAEYMVATGDFCEPESRIPFTNAELQQLELAVKGTAEDGAPTPGGAVSTANRDDASDSCAPRKQNETSTVVQLDAGATAATGASAGVASVSNLVHARASTAHYAEEAFRRDAVLGLERCAGELVCEMLDLIEAVVEEREAVDDAQTRLLLECFPRFSNYMDSVSE